jgi:hypothetical protein
MILVHSHFKSIQIHTLSVDRRVEDYFGILFPVFPKVRIGGNIGVANNRGPERFEAVH